MLNTKSSKYGKKNNLKHSQNIEFLKTNCLRENYTVVYIH